MHPRLPEGVNPRKMLVLANTMHAGERTQTPQLFRKMSRAIRKLDSYARRRTIGRLAFAYGAQLKHRGPDSRAHDRAVPELAHRVEPVAHGAALGQRHLAQALAPPRL